LDKQVKGLPSEPVRPMTCQVKGLPSEAGSMDAIIKEFTRSMKKVSNETTRHLQHTGTEKTSSSIREAWATGVNRQSSQPASPRSREGSVSLQGGPRSPRPSPRGTPRDASRTSLKAAAISVVGQGTSGLRSGLLSGKETPQGAPGSPHLSQRQINHSDSAHSLMLTAPWQQYKSVAKRMQEGEGHSISSSPSRNSLRDSWKAMGSSSDRDGGYAQSGGPPPRALQHFESMPRAASETSLASSSQVGGSCEGRATSSQAERQRMPLRATPCDKRSANGSSSLTAPRVKAQAPEVAPESTHSSPASPRRGCRPPENTPSGYLEETSKNGLCFLEGEPS